MCLFVGRRNDHCVSVSLQTAYETSQPELACLCLDVVGKFVSWIDITLVANDHYVPVLLRFLSQPLLRESACDCIYEVLGKGMEPMAKLRLVESFVSVLDSAGVLNPPEVSTHTHPPQNNINKTTTNKQKTTTTQQGECICRLFDKIA